MREQIHEYIVEQRLEKLPNVKSVSDLHGLTPASDFVTSVPIAFARKQKILGVNNRDGRSLLAIGDPSSLEQVQIISRFLKRDLLPILAPAGVILAAINDAY